MLHRTNINKILCCTEQTSTKYRVAQNQHQQNIMLHRTNINKISCCTELMYIHFNSCSSSSSSESDEGSNSENEPVTSTVPELEGEQLPPELKSNRPSWLYRRSRTPSPTMEADRKEEKVVSTRQPTTAASYKPKFVSRNNQVRI